MATDLITKTISGPIKSRELILLEGATQAVVGASFPVGFEATEWAWQVIVTGSPTSHEVRLEASKDHGVTWIRLCSNYDTNAQIVHLYDEAYTHVRANLVSLEGGSSPTVTVLAVPKQKTCI